MPGGKVHHALWLKFYWIVVFLGTLVLAIAGEVDVAIGFVVGYSLGGFVSPDLDLVGINSDESRMMDRFKILGVFMVMYWLPYAYVMRFVGIGRKGHRNFFSHFPFISTAIRIGYILLPVGFIMWWYRVPVQPWMWQSLIGSWLGLAAADTIHAVADVVKGGG